MNLLLGLCLLAWSTSQMSLLGTNVVGRLEEGAASAAYLQPGDRIVEVNGCATPGYNDVVFQLIRDADGLVDLTVLRGGDLSMTRWERTLARMGMGEKSLGEELYLSVPFQMEEVEEGLRTLKIDFVFLGAEKTLGNAVYYTFQQTISTVKQVWYSLLDIVTGRFGLSQLHQLRGRVGRGSAKSCCILLSDARGDNARERLRLMTTTGDGFQVAEYDLRTRGPGDFFGMRQHGLPQLQFADLATDSQVLRQTQQTAARLLAEDPALRSVPQLAKKVARMTEMVSGGI